MHLKHSPNFEVEVIDKSREITMIAVQGPKALSLIKKIVNQDISEYGRFSCYRVKLAGYDCYLCRTGYTGEDGVEVLVLDTPFNDEGREKAISFWEELLKQGEEFGVKACGLGARDSTRLEAGFVLYGHELDEETSPIEARIPYAVKFKVEPHYIGYDVVKHHKKEGGISYDRPWNSEGALSSSFQRYGDWRSQQWRFVTGAEQRNCSGLCQTRFCQYG